VKTPIFTLAILALSAGSALAGQFEFHDGDRVVLIGSTLIEREQSYGYWEAAITARNPDKNITFRNLGWSGDTVWGEARAVFGSPADGYKSLIDHVKAEKPTVIIVGYGTNESFAGEQGLPRFKEQYKKLLDDLAVTKARLVLLSPLRIRKMPPPLPDPAKANANLKIYSEAIRAEAEQRKALFVSMFDWLPTDTDREDLYFESGMHPTAVGYHSMETLWSRALGGPGTVGVVDIDVSTGKEGFGRAVVESAGSPLSYKVTERPLPSCSKTWEGELLGSLVMFRNLPEGNYSLRIDGKLMRTQTTGSKTVLPTERWRQGVSIYNDPDSEQFEQLRRTIIEKNQLYFHRWRPQNVTYLFLFRKHEQGNNAVEIPKFDPLVEAKEKEIAKLRVPREHVFELVPEKK
jgi:lysophospholipase L1-like esterase